MDCTECHVTPNVLCELAVDALEDRKGRDIVTLDVGQVTDIADFMVIVSGTSSRHGKSLVDEVIARAKKAGNAPLGVEGRETHEWVLVDLGDVLVHVMQLEAREFYDLERLWGELPADEGTLS
jgi:ribosome-associated protein